MTEGDARDWSGPEGDDELVADARRDLGNGPSTEDVAALAALTVVSGTPDEDELAALLAGLATARALARTDDADGGGTGEAGRPRGGVTAGAAGSGGAGRATSAWGDHAHRLGVRRAGAGAWRWSAQR
ncbi:acyl-CoA carboxylase epsilon subunit [Georgenia sp. Z1344]|uniref:acyl-CoA carboxylase epsilon subunit n=1 Tax=Georgenia sp. Z1344 TaxID=3416706 RepID=UPI003CF889BD